MKNKNHGTHFSFQNKQDHLVLLSSACHGAGRLFLLGKDSFGGTGVHVAAGCVDRTSDSHLLYLYRRRTLWVDKGRFSRKTALALSDISKVEVVRSSALSLLKNKDTVMLTLRDGSLRFITPFPADDFCRYLNHRKENEHEQAENV